MCALYLLILGVLVVGTKQDENFGYCDATRHCNGQESSLADKRLLFYDVNPLEGFNLRRDVYMRFAILLHDAQKRSKRKDWILVLPPFYKLYHWRSNLNNKPLSWSEFFDVPSLKTFAPVVDLHEVFIENEALEIDVLYMLQGFEEPFERGIFEDKWQITKDCEYEGHFWGYKNITVKEVVCIRYQGLIGKLWEVISLHPNAKKVMITHGEIPLHDHYGSKTYWDCRKSIKFNKNLIVTAKKYISDNFNCDVDKCSNYISVHWRRQDFAISRSQDLPSIHGTVKQLENKATKLNITNIFIATDAPSHEKDKLRNELDALGYKVYYYVPSDAQMMEFKDGGVAIIEQIISSHSAYFIGTHESTFTFRIQEEREIIGFDSSTTFNRFCPDTGYCEKPSKWTIVN